VPYELQFTTPSKPLGFDNLGVGGPILGLGIFETPTTPSDACGGCGVYVPCIDCAYGGSWVYDLAPWDSTVYTQVNETTDLLAGTTYYARWMIRSTSGEDVWSAPTAVTTWEAAE